MYFLYIISYKLNYINLYSFFLINYYYVYITILLKRLICAYCTTRRFFIKRRTIFAYYTQNSPLFIPYNISLLKFLGNFGDGFSNFQFTWNLVYRLKLTVFIFSKHAHNCFIGTVTNIMKRQVHSSKRWFIVS